MAILRSVGFMTEDNYHRLCALLQSEIEKQGKSYTPTQEAMMLTAKYRNAYYKDRNGSLRRVFPKLKG